VVTQWAVCTEDHADGGKHYHMALKLSATRRWRSVFTHLRAENNITVNFSSKNCGYLAAYRYVCKSKSAGQVLHSPGHPNLTDVRSPPSKKASQAYSENARKRRQSRDTEDEAVAGPSKPKRLSNIDVSLFLVENEIKNETELMSVAKQRQEEGQTDLYNFIINKNPKALADLISTTWRIDNAPAAMERDRIPLMEVVRRNLQGECVQGCVEQQWYKSARQVLHSNQINTYAFADAVRQCLIKGRQKNINIMLVGPTNCGKSFLLNPLELMFKCFVNPATGRYAWVGLDECEVAYLNDFRWSPELIAWNDFLLLLEGQSVHLPRPKNQFATDMFIDRENTLPFFATSSKPIEFVGKYNSRDERETEMMASRWRLFNFTKQIPPEAIKVMPPCPKCFGTLVIQGWEG